MSVMLFLYFCFPYIVKYIKKVSNKKAIVIMSFSIIIAQICVALLVKMFSESVYNWFTYCFPIFRLGDFIIGCNLGYLLTSKKASDNKDGLFKASIVEIFAIGTTVLAFVFARAQIHNFVLNVFQNWTTIWIIIATIWVYLFYQCKGVITKLFTNQICIFIGNISAYAFLIHYVITQYYIFVRNYMNWNFPEYINLTLIFVQYVVSILLSYIYSTLTKEKIETA
ncbi:MAG: hypothetical protein KHZ94_01895 [Anaerostipes sp.]|nr:hypothetical protein [Anaerostipes sp.]